jgi:hypothetical protein
MNFDTGVSILCEFAGDEDLLSLAYISDELALDGHFGAVGLRHGGSCGVVGLWGEQRMRMMLDTAR